MNTDVTFLPIKMMVERVSKSKDDSDTSYFYDLMLLGELVIKIVVSSLVAGIVDEKDRNRYRQYHRLVRADGIGEWSSVLDEILSGVPSQFLQKSITTFEQKELQTKTEIGDWQFEMIKHLTDIFPLVRLEKVDLPRRIQGRLWFSFFAQLRNGTKAHGALQPSECSNACLNLEKSIKILIENLYLFKRECVFLSQNLNGKYRVTNLNHTISLFEELKSSKENISEYPNGVYLYFDNRTLVELIDSNSDATDFFFPNGAFREKAFEKLSYFSNHRLQAENSKYLIPANELPESETQGLGLLEVQNNIFGNIPALSSEYISRKGLEESLTRVLNQLDRYPIVTLLGRGGIGKTTLALSVLHEITNSDRFEVIVWFSSRDIDLKMEGPKPVKNSMYSEADLASEYTKLLGVTHVLKTSEKIEYLASQMTKCEFGKTLFVLDNFETVQNPTELFSWIDTYVRNPNKVLITSRISKSFKADYPIEIVGMTDQECRELIINTSESLGISSLIDDELMNKIIDESQGHPYVIKILLGQIAKNPKNLVIERIMASQDDILIALFRRTFNTLTPASKRIFLTLCSWRSMVPILALEAVMLRPDIKEKIDIEEAVDELKRTSFIDIISADNESSSFISVPLAAFLFGKGELEVSPMKIAILSDRDLLQEFGVTQQSDLQNGIKPKIERKFRVVAKRITHDGESFEVHKEVLEFLCRKYPYAWNYYYQLCIENDKYSEAEESLRSYLKNTITNDERKYTLNLLASLYRLRNDWFAEINTLTEMIFLPNATLEEISNTANSINNYFYKDDVHVARLELDDDIKESLVKKVAELFENKLSSNSLSTATDYSRLAWLYMHLKFQEKAISAIEKGLTKDYHNPYCRKLAEKFQLI